jgi:succinate dehydrogenase / fumarate reductase iron-sulfur subunit
MPKINFVINRFDGQKEYRQEYELDCQPGVTLLAALIRIREELDPTLNFTASCRSAICGACAVRVNGSPFLACDTRVDDLVECFGTTNLTLAPIGNYPVISDLVVNWEAKLGRLASVKPGLIASEEFSAAEGCRQAPADFQKLRLMWDCILCGCCASECGKLTYNPEDFNEPYVYSHARRYAEDSRDRAPLAHAVPTLAADGLWKCIHCMQCVTNCPKNLEPAEDIAHLRALTVAAGYDDGVGPRHAKAFAADLAETGRLNEVKMALRTEGLLKNMAKFPFALRMLSRGKLNPLAVFHSKGVEGQEGLCKILAATKEADKS